MDIGLEHLAMIVCKINLPALICVIDFGSIPSVGIVIVAVLPALMLPLATANG